MTKNPRDHNAWTNAEIQEDSAGYLAAQQAYREALAAETQRRRDADDLERFTEAFVAAGGDKGVAAAAFKAHRNEQAAAAAKHADAVAGGQSRRRIAQAL